GGTPAGSTDVWVRAYDSDNDPSGATTADDFNNLTPRLDPTGMNANFNQDTITAIYVNGVSVNLATLDSDGKGGYLLRGFSLNDKITVETLDGYNRVEIENPIDSAGGPANLTGDSYDVGNFAFQRTG